MLANVVGRAKLGEWIDPTIDPTNGAVDLHGRPPRPGVISPEVVHPNVVCRAQLGVALPAFGLCFSTHSFVRYIERHVDATVVETLRSQGLDDHQILDRLKTPCATELDAFVTRATHAYEGCRSATRYAMYGLTYTLNVGHIPLRIRGDMCVTVMPAHWHDEQINRKYQTPRTWRRRRLERLTLDAA